MTKEKNDMTNEHNFKVGDRVRLKGNDAFVGTIVDIGLYSADILWDCDPDEIYLQAFDCIEHIDRRSAFLTRLQSLLREFDAEIGDSGIRFLKGMEITFGTDTPRIRYNHCTINADNIMDFDME